MAWFYNGNAVLSRRASTSTNQPTHVTQQPQRIINGLNDTFQDANGWTITFSRPKAAISCGGVERDISGSSTDMIWAYGKSLPSTADPTGDVPMHNSKGNVLKLNIYSPSAVYDPNNPNVGASSTGSSTDDKRSKAHGIIMALAWQLFAPLSIYAVAFGKKTLKKHRINVHRYIFVLLVIVPSIVGIIIVSLNVDGKHFDPSNYTKWGFHVVIISFRLDLIPGYWSNWNDLIRNHSSCRNDDWKAIRYQKE
jgi:hypothetical protein